MQYKYLCSSNDPIVKKLIHTIAVLKKPQTVDINITDLDLDKILSKYYADFTLDKCEDMQLGFTNTERINFRNNIKSIVADIVNKNIPKDFLIKG
jgi:hypothetical protein